MSEKQWNERLTDFLKKAGEDVRRTTEGLKVEAQKLVDEVRDPQNQQKVKEVLGNLGTWTEKVARDAAVMMEAGMKKAEEVLSMASSRSGGQEPAAPQAPSPAPAASSPKRPRAKAKGKAAAKKAPARKAGASKSRAPRPAARKRK